MPQQTDPAPRGEKKNIVIIGGGVAGTLSAFELQRAGHQVTLLEARAFGNGSSSRSAACIRQQFQTPSTVKGMIYCTRYYERWEAIVGGAQSPIVQNGYLFLNDRKADIEAVTEIVRMQWTAGLDEIEMLGAEDLHERFPYLETTDIAFATWCPTDGFLYPGIVYGDAAAAAQRLGAVTFQNEEVTSVEFVRGESVAVKTTSGKVFPADVFVNAAGVWSPLISGLFRGYPVDVKARKRYLYFLEGYGNGRDGQYLHPEEFPRLPMTITPRGGYCRPESGVGGKLMMGWLHPARATRPGFEKQDAIEPGFSHRDPKSYGLAVRKEITAYLPDADSMGSLSAVTSGFYEDTPDHNPLIGYDPWVANLIHAAGFSGHGVMHAPFTARIVANLVANGGNLEAIDLPFGIGSVEVKTFAVDREFRHVEGMVL